MAHRYDPLYERLKIIVKRAGGYDFEYHIFKVAKENNISREIVIKIFEITFNEKARDKYIQLYKEGYGLDYIQKIENIRRYKRDLELNTLLNPLFFSSINNNLF